MSEQPIPDLVRYALLKRSEVVAAESLADELRTSDVWTFAKGLRVRAEQVGNDEIAVFTIERRGLLSWKPWGRFSVAVGNEGEPLASMATLHIDSASQDIAEVQQVRLAFTTALEKRASEQIARGPAMLAYFIYGLGEAPQIEAVHAKLRHDPQLRAALSADEIDCLLSAGTLSVIKMNDRVFARPEAPRTIAKISAQTGVDTALAARSAKSRWYISVKIAREAPADNRHLMLAHQVVSVIAAAYEGLICRPATGRWFSQQVFAEQMAGKDDVEPAWLVQLTAVPADDGRFNIISQGALACGYQDLRVLGSSTPEEDAMVLDSLRQVMATKQELLPRYTSKGQTIRLQLRATEDEEYIAVEIW